MSGPFKMKNTALKMSAKVGSPMQANYNSSAKESKNSEKKDKRSIGKKAWDKLTQIGEGIKGGLYAESSSRGTNVISSIRDAYNKEKKADEKAGRS